MASSADPSFLFATAGQLLTITPSSPNGTYRPVTVGIAGDVPLDMVPGSGGWQVVDRPKQTSATQWYDRSPFQLVIPCIIDPTVTLVTATTPDQDVAQMMSWASPPSLSGSVIQPPTFKLSGPLLGASLTWVLTNMSFPKGLRDASSGALLQQDVTLTFYEYNSPFATTTLPTPTKASFTTYVIRSGDTLASIARKKMPKVVLSKAEAEIIALNKPTLKAANQIPHMVGKTIKIPSQ